MLSVERHMGNVSADVRYAVRLLIRKPGFAAVAILTLALGIGATTAIFTVVHAVLLRPLPFPDAGRLVEVRIVGRNAAVFPLPDTDFLAWRSQTTPPRRLPCTTPPRRRSPGTDLPSG